MKIKLSNRPRMVAFGDINVGEAFFYPDGIVKEGNLYIKTDYISLKPLGIPSTSDEFRNAVCLNDGTAIGIFDSEEVRRAAVEIVTNFGEAY